MLSFESRKYLNRAACMSGSAFLYYSYLDKNHLDRMYEFARSQNSTANNVDDLIKFLKNAPAESIVENLSQREFKRTLQFDFAPVIEC